MASIKLLNEAVQNTSYAVTDAIIMSVLIMAYSTARVVEENTNKILPFQAPLQVFSGFMSLVLKKLTLLTLLV